GRMSAVLTVLPPDLTGLAADNDGVFPVSRVVRQIDGRDPMLAHGGAMPLFGDFFEGDDVAIPSESGQPILTSRPIADVAAWLESVQE
ncbi:MAG: cytochrome c, partial [Pseudomonadota bacterium]